MVFTGHEFADGGETILNTLNNHHIEGSFFFTGDFYSNPDFKPLITEIKRSGHYLGAHSDKHLLYADWSKRDSLLVTRDEFTTDLKHNYRRMAGFGIKRSDAPYFLPPYEWYNSTITSWTKDLGLQLINFTPGTRSTADYTYPGMTSYKTSDEIYKSITDYERKDPNGLNGFILLIHIGTDPKRTDKFYNRLDALISELKGIGYTFVRVDDLVN